MKMMNKSDLISKVAKKDGLSKKDTSNAINALTNTIQDALANGKGVRLVNFGSFVVRHRKARTGRNPQTGAPLRISSRMSPAFRAGKGLKDSVNK